MVLFEIVNVGGLCGPQTAFNPSPCCVGQRRRVMRARKKRLQRRHSVWAANQMLRFLQLGSSSDSIQSQNSMQPQLVANEVNSSSDAANSNVGIPKTSLCSEVVNLWPSQAVRERPYSSGSSLPLDIWEHILKLLCRDVEVNGVRSPSVVARDICNASLASKELWTASQTALQHLSSESSAQSEESALAIGCPIKSDWNDFLSRPQLTNAEEVTEIAMACKWDGLNNLDKSALILTTFNYLHLGGPSIVPFHLLYAVARERHTYSLRDYDSTDLRINPLAETSDMKCSILLNRLGIHSQEDLDQATNTPERRLLALRELCALASSWSCFWRLYAPLILQDFILILPTSCCCPEGWERCSRPIYWEELLLLQFWSQWGE